MKILITAFEPFGGRKINTSADLLRAFRKNRGDTAAPSYSFAILPVSYRKAWPQLRTAIRKHRPKALVMMGEKKSERMTIESTARNRRKSGRGLIAIRKDSPAKIKTKLHLPPPAGMLASNHAGTYLCNFVYYKTLSHETELAAVFIHVPAMDYEDWRACQKNYVAGLKKILVLIAKAIDGAGRNGEPSAKRKRGLIMADKHLVACEQEHEIITVLKHFKKGSSKENVDKMQTACRAWKKDGGAKYKPKNRDNFYKYLQEKGILRKLS